MTDHAATAPYFPSATRDGIVITLLILLSAVPVGAGAVRLGQLAGGVEITPDNARFFAAPLPVVLHILSVSVYCILGAFQVVLGFRQRRPRWHRTAGMILVPCGLVAALTGLWMTLFFALPAHDGPLLAGFRLLFGSAMLVSIVFALTAIRRRDFAAHGAWMIRGYAIGLGAGTQFLTGFPWIVIFGPPGELARALLMGASWGVNVVVAEWIIRRRAVA